MSVATPRSRPQWPREKVTFLLAKHHVSSPVAIVGVRGYYRDTLGVVGRNDRGIYDDAMFVISPNVFASFWANTDPSIHRAGIAVLRPGVHLYRKGKHGISKPGGGYPALRPATKDEALPVDRDGVKSPKPGIAINIHKGSYTSTSSEGCQTIYPAHWNEFLVVVYGEMDRCGVTTIPYLLVEEQG